MTLSGLLASYIDVHAAPALQFAMVYTLTCQTFANVSYSALKCQSMSEQVL